MSSVLFFYSGSADKKAGMGAGELLRPGEDFSELDAIVHWRRKLSNFYPCELEIDGKIWPSVEHYYQGSKFTGDPEYRQKFEKFGDFVSPEQAKRAGGKNGAGVLDEDFFRGRAQVEMRRALEAKFSKPEFAAVLRATKNAILTHGTRGVATTRQETLMEIRATIARG